MTGRPPCFDPFNDRRARDIRNHLAKLFLQALARNDLSQLKQEAEGLLGQGSEHVYREYVTTRLKKYDESLAIIRKGGLDATLRQADVLWDQGLYFEMHELLEQAWKAAKGDRRTGLQGLIRAAGMKIHGESGNTTAAQRMGGKARVQLQEHGRELSGFTRLAEVLAEIERNLATPRNHSGNG